MANLCLLLDPGAPPPSSSLSFSLSLSPHFAYPIAVVSLTKRSSPLSQNSRVVLNKENNAGGSDYINASRVHVSLGMSTSVIICSHFLLI